MPSVEPPDPDDPLATLAPPRPENAIAGPAKRKRRRLPFRRSTTDRYLAGVAGGEGRRLGLDPFFLRLALVGATLILAQNRSAAFLLPLLAYLAAWLFWPTDNERSLARRLGQRAAQQEIGGAIAALILAIVVIGRPSLIWAGILLGAAVALLGNRTASAQPDGEADLASHDEALYATVVDSSPMTPEARAVSWGRSLRGAVGPRPGVRSPLAQRERPPCRSPALWPLTASLLFAYGFCCVLLDNLIDPGIDPGVAVNGAILIIAGVILVSGWRGRALLTSLLLVPLVPAWVAFSVADTPRFADSVSLTVPAEGYVDGQIIEQSRGYGGLSMTLAAEDLPESGEVTARVGLTGGQADIWVPKEADLRIVGHLGLGNIEVYEEPYFSAYDGDSLADYGLNRRYPARGRECFGFPADEEWLRNVADWSGVAVAPNATGDEIADAIEAAGYPRPTSEIVTDFGTSGDETDATVYDEVTGELLGVAVPDGAYKRTEWTYQANENSGLCLPKAPPDNPVLITIEATIGLGNLKVHRV